MKPLEVLPVQSLSMSPFYGDSQQWDVLLSGVPLPLCCRWHLKVSDGDPVQLPPCKCSEVPALGCCLGWISHCLRGGSDRQGKMRRLLDASSCLLREGLPSEGQH